MLAGAALAVGVTRPARALERSNDEALVAEVESPPVVVPETGRHLDGPFLRWWLQHGRDRLLGWPLTDRERIDGQDVQLFERGGLVRIAPGASAFAVAPIDLGQRWAPAIDPGALDAQVGDPRAAYWFWQTQRGVHPSLWSTFVNGGGAGSFGYPISHAVVRNGEPVQWFTRARMRLTAAGVVLDPIGAWEAERLGLVSGRVAPPIAVNGPTSTAPTFQDRVQDDLGGWAADRLRAAERHHEVQPRAVPYEPGIATQPVGDPASRWVGVDVSRQVATFYAGEAAVRRVVISTGRIAGWTPDGDWPVVVRRRNERMIGGEPGTAWAYDLSDVFYTQYFTWRWHALHYAWWHDEFGTVQSHGCVNLRLDDAAFAWAFCAEGTPVLVRNAANATFEPPA